MPRLTPASLMPVLKACVAWGWLFMLPDLAFAGDSVVPGSAMPWWFWPLALFVTCFLIGIVAVPAGIGGGTLFVPIIGGFFPFHLDFVRGAGLLVALASALAAGPFLLRGGLASLRLALPLALLACIPLQIAFTHAPILQTIFDSTALTMQEWAKVLGAGLLVFCVAELEKTIIRRSPLAARLVHA